MTKTPAKKRPQGTAKIRSKTRYGEKVWGYDVWLRQTDKKRKRFRDFTFRTKGEAEAAFEALKATNSKKRYGISPPENATATTVKVAVAGYQKLALAKLVTKQTSDTPNRRIRKDHLFTLDRFVNWIGPDRLVSSIVRDDFIFWIAAEMERTKAKGRVIEQSSVKRGLNTIRAALNHAVESGEFPDLRNYRVPTNPLKQSVEKDRDRVLSEDEIAQIIRKLEEYPKFEEALFFFRIDIITGARMAELLRMKWDESSIRFGTVKLFSGKTGKWRTIQAPAAAQLIAKRKAAKLGGNVRVLTQPDHWFRDVFRQISESLGILYGQRVPGGWTIHDLRHTCLTYMALGGMPIHGIKEFAGHASIEETQRYLKYMPEQMEIGANISNKLAELTHAAAKPTKHRHDVECPNCAFVFNLQKRSHLELVGQTTK